MNILKLVSIRKKRILFALSMNNKYSGDQQRALFLPRYKKLFLCLFIIRRNKVTLYILECIQGFFRIGQQSCPVPVLLVPAWLRCHAVHYQVTFGVGYFRVLDPFPRHALH